MKDIKNAIEKNLYGTLEEAATRSLVRALYHFQRHDIGILTAFRGLSNNINKYIDPKEQKPYPDAVTRNKADNRKNNEIVKNTLISKGYSFYPVTGSYIETVKGQPVTVDEESMIVVDHKHIGNLKEVIVALGKKFDQDSVLFKSAGENPILIGTNNTAGWIQMDEVVPLGKHTFEKPEMVFTKMKNGRTFHFKQAEIHEAVFDDYIKKEAMERYLGRNRE